MAKASGNSKSIYFALVGVGSFVVACAAFMSYLFSLGLNGQLMNGQDVARRMVIILFLVVSVFELALWLLHRVIARMDEIINNQTRELEGYSRQLETVVAEQLGKIRKVMAQFQAVTANIPIIMLVLDKDSHIVFADGSGWQKFSMRAKDCIGKNIQDVLPDAEVIDRVRRVQAGERQAATHQIKGNWLATHYAPLTDPDGARTGAIIVAVDVTQEHADGDPCK